MSLIDSTIAHYRIVSKLGQGGMGEVYLADDTRLERQVALKFLPPHVEQAPEVLKRFEREAKATASLNHPNIVTIHEIGIHEDRHYIVMSYIEGELLRDRINRGGLALREALSITRDLCDALGEAHRAGVVHRDLKPENIIIDGRGRPHVLDFGLALRASETRLTTEGATVGSLLYMSPEQARGDAVDERTDIFSLGAILYEMIAGRPPFAGDHPAAISNAINNDTPHPLARYSSDVDPEVERIVGKALAKDPDVRYQTMSGVAADIRALGATSTDEVRVDGTARRSPLAVLSVLVRPAVIAALVVGALGIVAGVLLSGREGGPEAVPVRLSVLPPEGGGFDLHPAGPGPVAVSPDGTRLVYAASGADGPVQLWVRGLDDFEARPLPDTEDATYPFWSPDSRSIAFYQGGKLKKMSADGGPSLSLADAGPGAGGTWNRDGTILFAPYFGEPIYRVSESGGDAEAVTVIDTLTGENGHCQPRFLPDGERFLFIARMPPGTFRNSHRLMLGSLSGEPERELMKTFSPAEVAGGYLWFVDEGTLLARPFDVERAEFTGPARPVGEGAINSSWAAWVGIGYFSVSPAGVIAYHTGRAVSRSVLTWYDRSGNELSTVGVPEHQYQVSISPGRTRAIVQLEADAGTAWSLWEYDLDRGTRSLLTPDPSATALAVWSPDGQRIAFGSTRSGNLDVYVKPVAGGEVRPLLAPDLAGRFDSDWALDWSPDGRYVVYCDNDDGNVDMWAYPIADGGEPIPIRPSPFDEEDAALSPDGRWLAYISNETGRFEVYVTDFPAGTHRWQLSEQGGIRPEWSPNGDEVFFLSPTHVLMSAHVGTGDERIEVKGIHPLFSVNVRRYVRAEPGGYAVGPGAQRFLVNRLVDAGSESAIRVIVGWPPEERTDLRTDE